MTLFNHSEGSLLSDERLLHARDTYRPSLVLPSGEMAFAHWTERVSAQPALVTARELAGLPHENLNALATEFGQAPRLKRKYSWSLPAGLSAMAIGAAFLGLQQLADSKFGLTALTVLGSLSLLCGGISLGFAIFQSYQTVPLDRAHGLLGLYVGELNEQHPWLYRTALLTHNAAANAYRIRILQERGVLRGVDYVMMTEIAAAHENMELTTSARTMRERVQSLPPSIGLPTL